MQGVVPAAGEGTRLRPRTADRPKGLVEVAGKPLLGHVFETLVDLGVSELIVVVGHRSDAIRERFGAADRGVPITYVTQTERRGLAHAVALAARHVDGDFLCLNGDNVCRANLGAVVERHRGRSPGATCLVERVSADRASEGGVFALECGEVVGAIEKPADPPSRLVPRGFFAFDERVRHACELVRPGHTGERELTRALDLLLSAGWDVETVPIEGWCLNVNDEDDLAEAAARLGE